MNISAIIIIPDLFSPWVGACFMVLQKDHIRFYTWRVKYPCRQSQNRMYVRSLQKLFADNFTAPPSKAHYRNNDCSIPFTFSIVLICCTKLSCLLEVVVQTHCCRSGRILRAISICDGHRAFLAEGRICKDIVIASKHCDCQCIIPTYQNLTRQITNIMQIKVH